jgi:chromosome partitioning protein
LEKLNAARRPMIISFVGKGGTAKTTSAVSIAMIAAYRDHRVWVLDLDPQASASAWRNKRGAADEWNHGANVVVHRCASRNLQRAIDAARREGVDLVVIDNPPRRHEHAIDVARSADLVVVTCGASLFDLEDTLNWMDFLRLNGIQPCVVLGNAAPRRDNMDSLLIADARLALMKKREAQPAEWPAPNIWSEQVTRRHAVIRAVATGSTTVETEPSGASAVEFRKLWTFLVQQLKESKR